MSRSRWLTDIADRPGVMVCCLPHAGAGSFGYRSWTPHLTSDEALAIGVLPGREHRLRERPARSAPEVVEPLAAAIAARRRPSVLFGHSMGALLAFGVAQWLRDNGGPEPLALVVSGSGAPHLPRDLPQAGLLDDRTLIQLVRRLGGTPDAVFTEPALRDHVLGVLRADLAVAGSFVAAPGPVTCPVLGVHARGDASVSASAVREWVGYTSAQYRFVEIDGDHFSPVNDAATFLRTLRTELSGMCTRHRVTAC